MKKIYLHIGLFKTASTFLQYQLVENSDSLLKEGVLYFHDFYHFFTNMVNEMPFTSQTADKYKEWTDRLHDIKQDTIVLSCESLCYLHNPSEMIDNLLYIFQEFSMEIILVVRRQDTFIESMYAQAVKMGEKQTFQENYDKLSPATLDWYGLAKSYQYEWPIYVIPFEIIKEKKLASEFLKIFSKVTPAPDKIVNPTLSVFHQRELLTPEQRRELLDYHREGNEKLFKEFMPNSNLFNLYKGE